MHTGTKGSRALRCCAPSSARRADPVWLCCCCRAIDFYWQEDVGVCVSARLINVFLRISHYDCDQVAPAVAPVLRGAACCPSVRRQMHKTWEVDTRWICWTSRSLEQPCTDVLHHVVSSLEVLDQRLVPPCQLHPAVSRALMTTWRSVSSMPPLSTAARPWPSPAGACASW